MKHQHALKPVYVCVLIALTAGSASANPYGATVVNGQASFATAGSTLTVTNTPGAIINWQGFSIGSNEITRFVQQSASSAVLNRVISGNPSSILGSLLSNGRVYLVNPNGIVFGAGSTINVAGLVATTLNLSDADFLAGRNNFTQVPGAQNISNAGNIAAQTGGQIFLIAPNVENTGVINAPNGEILLAAGHSVELVNSSEPSLRVNITAPAGDATNVGQLVASAGNLGLFGAVVRNSGTISADSAVMQGGKIVLKATQRVEAGGTISASGVGGGEIKLLADMQDSAPDVNALLGAFPSGAGIVSGNTLANNADSSSVGGLVGYNSSAVPQTTPVTQGGGVLVATGSGGVNIGLPDKPVSQPTFGLISGSVSTVTQPVVARVGGAVNVTGTLDASAPNSGNGGFIETSAAHVHVADTARITTAAPFGKSGIWLIDPQDFTIAATGGDITGAALSAALNSGSVLIQSISGAVAGSGDIFVSDNITKTALTGGATTLTLQAESSILVSAGKAISSSGAALDVVLNADTDGANGGAIAMASGSSISSNGGNITLGGGTAGDGTGNAIGTSANKNGIDLLGASLNAGAGSITLNGQGYDVGGTNMGVYLHSGSTLTTTTGNVIINGSGGGMTDMSAGSNRGVRISSASAIITGTGNIDITGQGGWDGDGVQVVGGAQVKSTGGGQITLNGSSGSGTGLDYGIYLTDAGTLVETSGNIVFSGVSNSVAGADNKGIALYETNLGTPLTDGPKVSALGSGNISFNGTGGGGTQFSSGMTISGSEVSVADGTLTLNGTSGNATGSDNRGVNLHSGAWVHATGSGNINIAGVAVNSATASFGSGVRIATGAIVETVSGAININGSGMNGTDSNYGVLIT
ncbi:MAG: filamentous hemagglutinin N-terminal domain-containing protein, partial [Nitrosomonadales bacterium]|nr:filamentous hemagglutinin N-terminal domain-containing protein [Nitrosomonadales bacterium]